QLVDAEGAVLLAEQRQRDERGRRDRRHAVDADRHLEGELLEREVRLVGGRLRGRVRRSERPRERDRLAEADVDAAVAPAEPTQKLERPAEALRLLLSAPRFGRVAGDVADLIVGD